MNSFNNYFEDFYKDQLFEHWPGKTVFESDNNLFSLITMNHHPVHLDVNFCKNEHQHKKILVVGTLVLSLVVGMTVRDISGNAIANLEYERVVHNAPVFINDTIYAKTKVISVRESNTKKDRGIVYVETKGYNQNDQVVITFRRKVLIPKKNA